MPDLTSKQKRQARIITLQVIYAHELKGSDLDDTCAFMLDEDKDFNNNVIKSSDEEKSDEEEGKEDENINHGNIFGRRLNIDFSKSPLDIPNSVGSIAEENVRILSKFS